MSARAQRFLNAVLASIQDATVEGMSDKELAYRAGISPSMLCKWRSGKVDLHQIEVMLRLLSIERSVHEPAFITNDYERAINDQVITPHLTDPEDATWEEQAKLNCDLWCYLHEVRLNHREEVAKLLTFGLRELVPEIRAMLALGVLGVLAVHHLQPNKRIEALAQRALSLHPWIHGLHAAAPHHVGATLEEHLDHCERGFVLVSNDPNVRAERKRQIIQACEDEIRSRLTARGHTKLYQAEVDCIRQQLGLLADDVIALTTPGDRALTEEQRTEIIRSLDAKVYPEPDIDQVVAACPAEINSGQAQI